MRRLGMFPLPFADRLLDHDMDCASSILEATQHFTDPG